MLRPRDSYDLRLIVTSLNISPAAWIRWVHDVFRNSIALASFTEPTTEVRIESILRLEAFPAKGPAFQISPEAVSATFVISGGPGQTWSRSPQTVLATVTRSVGSV